MHPSYYIIPWRVRTSQLRRKPSSSVHLAISSVLSILYPMPFHLPVWATTSPCSPSYSNEYGQVSMMTSSLRLVKSSPSGLTKTSSKVLSTSSTTILTTIPCEHSDPDHTRSPYPRRQPHLCRLARLVCFPHLPSFRPSLSWLPPLGSLW